MTRIPDSVLFCCTMNSVRSPMAAAIMRHWHGARIYVDSVGVRKSEIDGFAVAAMDEIGIDLQGFHAKTFDDLDDISFDLIISLSPEAHHKALELTRTMACEVEYWPTFDPTFVEGTREQRLAAYRDVRDFLLAKIRERFPIAGAPKV